jgi:hypothetical protein
VGPARLFLLVAAVVACPPGAGAIAQTTSVLVDRDLTVGAGATLVNAIGDVAASVQGRYIPDRLFDERGASRRSVNIGYRLLRLLFFDLPQEQWLLVASHEVAGHGGRVREFFEGGVRYHIDPPPPYGGGGGVTVFGIERDFTVHEIQSVSVAGMEVNAVAARQIAQRGFTSGRLSPRAALRYLGFELDVFEYIQRTGDEPERPGHDVGDFLELYNLMAEVAGAETLSPRTLRRQSWVSLANPMVASAAVTIARYLMTGTPDGPVFAIPIGATRVMPALRYRLTPFGPEWELASDATWRHHAARAAVRVGRAPLTRPWGVSLGYSGLTVRAWRLDLGVDVWRQPPLALGARSDFGFGVSGDDLEWGGQLRARAESPLVGVWWSRTPATLIVDAGLKSLGFVPGDPLGEGLVLRAGLGLPLGRR